LLAKQIITNNFNLQKHILVPKHEILSKKQAEEVLEKHHILALQLPIIKITDPLIHQLKAKSDDIIKITRSGPTGEFEFIRRVVE